jgi:hypothetical protein
MKLIICAQTRAGQGCATLWQLLAATKGINYRQRNQVSGPSHSPFSNHAHWAKHLDSAWANTS